jgi:hypothetical protein
MCAPEHYRTPTSQTLARNVEKTKVHSGSREVSSTLPVEEIGKDLYVDGARCCRNKTKIEFPRLLF